jgi:hypothetical protein
MTNRLDTLISRIGAFTLAVFVTLVTLASIDSLASREHARDALLAHHATSARAA